MTATAVCPTHRSERDAHQRRTVPTKTVERAERARRAAVVREHRDRYGDWCPGWRRPGHAASDLTADDVVPVMVTGAPSAVLRVLCRSCNSRRGATQAAAMRRGEPVTDVGGRGWGVPLPPAHLGCRGGGL